MGIAAGVQESLAAKFAALFPHLDERQRRLMAGAEARALGHGGIRVVARAAGMREGTVSRGVAELEAGQEPLGRARLPGGGRKRLAEGQAGDPVVSVDTKKKELVGAYKNGGREWRPKGDPAQVSTHDYVDPELGKAIPYGIYDLAANTGWVNVGTDHDTAAFAVESIRRWWHGQGRPTYPQATRLLINADAGGSNGYRTRAWKLELARLAAETGLTITVC